MRSESVLFARILVEHRVIGPGDLARLVALQQSVPEDQRVPIGELAVGQGYLDRAQLQVLLDAEGWRLHLGELLVMRGALTLPEMTRAVREQKAQGGLLGQVMLRLGLIEERDLAEALAEQCGVASVPISSIPPDPGLKRWVNAIFARSHGLVPVAYSGRSLVVAIWAPGSLAIASDVAQSSGLSVNVLLTTRREVEERIKALYGPTSDPLAA